MGGSKVFDLVLEIDRAKNERAIWKQRAEEAEAELKRTREELNEWFALGEELGRRVRKNCEELADRADLETNLRPGDADKLRAFLKQQDARCDAFWPAGPAALAVVCRLLLDEAGGS